MKQKNKHDNHKIWINLWHRARKNTVSESITAHDNLLRILQA